MEQLGEVMIPLQLQPSREFGLLNEQDNNRHDASILTSVVPFPSTTEYTIPDGEFGFNVTIYNNVGVRMMILPMSIHPAQVQIIN